MRWTAALPKFGEGDYLPNYDTKMGIDIEEEKKGNGEDESAVIKTRSSGKMLRNRLM